MCTHNIYLKQILNANTLDAVIVNFSCIKVNLKNSFEINHLVDAKTKTKDMLQ